MSVLKKKHITSSLDPSTSESSLPVLPQPQEFHQHLRTLAQSAVRVVIEMVMREDLEQFIGEGWGECSRYSQRVSLPQIKGDREVGNSTVLTVGT